MGKNPLLGVVPGVLPWRVSDTGSIRANHNLFPHDLLTLMVEDNEVSGARESAVISPHYHFHEIENLRVYFRHFLLFLQEFFKF